MAVQSVREGLPLIGKVLTATVVGAAVIPRLESDHWSARAWEFPRFHLAGLGLVAVAALSVKRSHPAWWLAATGATAWQASRILPYVPIGLPQVHAARGDGESLSIIVANVYQPNRRAGDLARILRRADADVVLALETDAWWCDRLETLGDTYPHVIRCDRPNTYGMMVLSKIPFVHADTKHMVEKDVPSIHMVLRLESGRLIALYCLHPKPPAPGETELSTERDVELLDVGEAVRNRTMPVIVAGDFNDVPWSKTSRRFLELSRLRDPRKGRGPLPTFPANHRLLSVPLDQVFVSEEFTLRSLQRLPDFGSDHRAILADLCLGRERIRSYPKRTDVHGILAEKRADLIEAEGRAQATHEFPMAPE